MTKYSINQKAHELEKYIDHWGKAQKIGAGNISATHINLNFETDIESSKYENFIGSGDYHYFIGRIIFTEGGGIYGFFCAQQCIENYFKAYVIYWVGKLDKSLVRKYSHDLHKWLDHCRNIAPKKSFLHTKRVKLIVTKYDPFNELPRYPVSRRGIIGSYAFIRPNDIYPLDYFVFRMRKEMPLPNGVWDILGDGRPFWASGLDKNDPLVQSFKFNNINY